MRRVFHLLALFYSGLLPFVPLRESFYEIIMPSILLKWVILWVILWDHHAQHTSQVSRLSCSLHRRNLKYQLEKALCNSVYTRWRKKTGPSYLIANILKTLWPNYVEILQYFLAHLLIIVCFDDVTLAVNLFSVNFIEILLSLIHTVQIDFSITQ